MSTEKMTDSMKAEFIDAFQAKFGFGVLTSSANDDAAAMLGAAAWAWQASRAAIEVELPRQHGVHYPRMFSDEVRTSIESLGLKVKP